MWAGRYPIHKRVEKMEPVKTHDGQTVARRYISRDELESAEALVKRLMREVQPWTL